MKTEWIRARWDTAPVWSSAFTRFGSFPTADRVNAELQTTGRLGSQAAPKCARWIILAWLALNLAFPPNVAAEAGPKLRSRPFAIAEADRAWWAFQPLKSSHGDSIDSLLSDALSRRGLTMNPPATPRALVRRAYFDLHGMPPSPEAVAAFEADPSAEAWERLIDRLLASPHYGERWGRHWLDLVRYAESNGYERDGPKPNAWRYRDYVIDSFNANKPYDRFIREQLAGDELAEELPAGAPDAATAWKEAIIATGFYRLHVWDDEPDSTVAAEYDDLDDIMVTTGTAFLGLTIGCARCHDHKFDPISQSDYYSLLSFFRGIDPYGQHKTGGGGRGTGRIQRPLVAAAEWNAWEKAKAERVRRLEAELKQSNAGEPRKQIEEALRRARDETAPFEFALAVAEQGLKAKPTYLLSRGDPHAPREEVFPRFPVILQPEAPTLPERPAAAASSGRRRVLAEWIAHPSNPLTARVMANRFWQRHFGAGLVPTPDDFGLTGVRPLNPKLLDYLAAEFVASGWDLKRLHTLIMTSRAYRMSSMAERPEANEVDEGNSMFWRQNLRRLEAEAVRDTMLAVSGTLNDKRGGPGVYPTLPPEVHGTQDSSGKGWADSPAEEQNRRSVYLVVKRALKTPLLECLDFANSASPAGTRPVTTTAPQALMLLNDGFMQQQAAALAERVRREADSDSARVTRLFQHAFQRAATEEEAAAVSRFLADQRERAARESRTDPTRAAWISLGRAVLNSNELIYVD